MKKKKKEKRKKERKEKREDEEEDKLTFSLEDRADPHITHFLALFGATQSSDC